MLPAALRSALSGVAAAAPPRGLQAGWGRGRGGVGAISSYDVTGPCGRAGWGSLAGTRAAGRAVEGEGAGQELAGRRHVGAGAAPFPAWGRPLSGPEGLGEVAGGRDAWAQEKRLPL